MTQARPYIVFCQGKKISPVKRKFPSIFFLHAQPVYSSFCIFTYNLFVSWVLKYVSISLTFINV